MARNQHSYKYTRTRYLIKGAVNFQTSVLLQITFYKCTQTGAAEVEDGNSVSGAEGKKVPFDKKARDLSFLWSKQQIPIAAFSPLWSCVKDVFKQIGMSQVGCKILSLSVLQSCPWLSTRNCTRYRPWSYLGVKNTFQKALAELLWTLFPLSWLLHSSAGYKLLCTAIPQLGFASQQSCTWVTAPSSHLPALSVLKTRTRKRFPAQNIRSLRPHCTSLIHLTTRSHAAIITVMVFTSANLPCLCCTETFHTLVSFTQPLLSGQVASTCPQHMEWNTNRELPGSPRRQ